MQTKTSSPPADQVTKERAALAMLAVLGAIVWVIALTTINIADTDLWAKMALGAFLLQKGVLLKHDVFAFTPVLPTYVDHEWGSGVVFFSALNLLGPFGLMALKIVLATAAVASAAIVARRQGVTWPCLLLLLPFVAWAILPGYAVVLRSHSFTYLLFGLALLLLEQIRHGSAWPGAALVAIVMFWVNLHGGVVAGLGLISMYALGACVERKHWKVMLITAAGCWLATLVNPHGIGYWRVLLPALAHARPEITEWQPLPLLANDVFVGFRVLFVLTIVAVVSSWRTVQKRSWAGLVMLALTAFLAWRSRRHAPFFALTALAIGAPYFQAMLLRFAAIVQSRAKLEGLARFAPLGILYIGIALWAFKSLLPQASLQMLAPVGIYPVREVDVLERAGVAGNVAVPFTQGSYVSWRLYPKIKVSMDGRYEAVYPESSFQMNQDFFGKRGSDWDRLLREFKVDFVMLNYASSRLRPEDLLDKGYVLIWQQPDVSALLALNEHAKALREVAATLPPTTTDPLTANIPRQWPTPGSAPNPNP